MPRTLAEDLLEELHGCTHAFLHQLVAAEHDQPYTNNGHYLADTEERARKAMMEQLQVQQASTGMQGKQAQQAQQASTDAKLSLSAEESSGLDTLAKADAYFKVGRERWLA